MLKLQKIMMGDVSAQKSLDFVRKVYAESFPPEERRPWHGVVELLEDADGPYAMYLLSDGDTPCAFLTVWRLGDVAYVEHFAVDAGKRGIGYGRAALEMLASVLGADTPVVVEVERAGTSGDADRRIRFYASQGFRPLDEYDYIQPPYSPGLPPVPLTLMVKNAAKAPSAAEIARLLHKKVYNQ